MGFEPMTSCLLDRRSNQLSYGASLGGLDFRWTKKTEECEADIRQ